ncbi:hypothetical protein Pcinc_030968 [Petrolisthes cinctipes]|nr:hypothetical protein Pcinc_030968 [Petrolisthes cinctipes]
MNRLAPPRLRKVSVRFLRRLQLSHPAKDQLVSPNGSSDSDPECGPPTGPTPAPDPHLPAPHIKYMPISDVDPAWPQP